MSKKVIKAGRIDDAVGAEISYVDHPANGKSKITGVTIAKRDDAPELSTEILEAAGVAPSEVSGIRKFFSFLLGKKEESTTAINDLPDSDFAYIEPGGKKDDEGKTTPRSKRHLPIHDAAHVRNALARLDQTDISDEAKKKALGRIKARAKKFGVKVDGESDKSATLGTLRKNLWDVGTLAEAVCRLDYMTANALAERDYEGDDSEVPERLAAARDELGQILIAMVEEEVGELRSIGATR